MVFRLFKKQASTPPPPAPALESEVKSPCTGVCDMDWSAKLCKSCRRTVIEIGHWGQMDDEQRLAVLDAVAERQQGS